MTTEIANPSGSPRSPLVECVVVAAIVFAAYAITRPPAVATLGRLYDDVVYLSVGKSIAEGHGYRSAQLVGTPVHVKFPPLLPAMYAVAWMAFGSLDAVARTALWLNIVATSLSAGILWWLARRVLLVGRVLSALFVIAPIVTDRTMFYFTGATSEPWMLLGWATALALAHRLTRIAGAGQRGAGTAVALGLVLALSTLARSQSIAIACGILLALAIGRIDRRTIVTVVVAMAVPLVSWNVWHGAMMARGPLSPLPDQLGYTAWIPTSGVAAFARFAASMMRLSVPMYWSDTAMVLVGWTSPKTLAVASSILLCGIIGSLMLWKRVPALTVSLIASGAVLAIWPYVQDRFLTPLLPVLGLAGAYAVDRALSRTPRWVRAAATTACVLLTAAILLQNGRMRREAMRGGDRSPYARAMNQMVAWVQSSTLPDDHVMVGWGGVIYLRTGRPTAIPNPEEPTLGTSVLAEADRFFATRLVEDAVDDLIIWDQAPGREAEPLRALAGRCPGTMTEVDGDPKAVAARGEIHFYRIHHDSPCLAALAKPTATFRSRSTNAP